MPEILTKHPEVVIQVLESGGAKCGDGLPQKILKQCPAASFCALPGGETCVYSVADVGKMTQIKTSELASHVCTRSAGGCSTGAVGEPSVALLIAAIAFGFACRRWSRSHLVARRR